MNLTVTLRLNIVILSSKVEFRVVDRSVKRENHERIWDKIKYDEFLKSLREGQNHDRSSNTFDINEVSYLCTIDVRIPIWSDSMDMIKIPI